MTPERPLDKYAELMAFIDKIAGERNAALAEVDALAARVRELEALPVAAFVFAADTLRRRANREIKHPDIKAYDDTREALRKASARALLAGDGRATEPETGGGG